MFSYKYIFRVTKIIYEWYTLTVFEEALPLQTIQETKGKDVMAKGKSDSKKLTLVYLQQLFLEKTDDKHFVRMPEILKYLEEREVFVDRRTIYTDLKLLDYAGFEIVGVPEKGGYKYHHPSRLFDTTELKFLVDSVAASKFLTDKKSRELISKVKTLGNSFDNAALDRSILSHKRVKTMNDKVFKNLDTIYFAISNNHQISFQYLKWTTDKKLSQWKGEKPFTTSPCAVSLSDDNYYLVGYDSRTKKLKHYRIDKMAAINLLQEEREGQEVFKTFDIVDYSKKTFGMFGGKEEKIMLEVANDLVGVFLDRFGTDIFIMPNPDNKKSCLVRVAVNVSPQFYGWLFGLGKKVKIVSPENVKKDFLSTLSQVTNIYE